jgi:hypothetical protein
MTSLERIEEWCEKIWKSELMQMQNALDYPPNYVRVAAVHTLKQALQIPPGLGAIYGCLSTIRATLTVIAILLAAITYRLFTH